MLTGDQWSDARLTIPGVSQLTSLGTSQWINSTENSYVLGITSITTAVARWNGSTLTRLPDLANISSIFVGDSLQGDQLFARVYVGSSAFSPTRVFRFVSDAWQEVNVFGATTEQINKMTFVDSQNGGWLVTIRTENSVPGIYTLTESGWSLLGDIQTRPALPNSPTGILLFASGTGVDSTLYVSGWIDGVGGTHVKNIGAYRNGVWFNPGDGLEIPPTNISYNRGERTASNIAIISQDAVGSPTERRGGAYRVRLLQNNGWIPITPGFVTNGGPNCTGPCITPLHLSASEDALYVGGMFSTITGDPNQQSLAKWNGNAWIGLGPLAMNGTVTDILQTDLGDGTELFVSGNFYLNVPNRLRNIARLTESGWQPVGNAPSTEINGYSSGIASLHSFAGQNGNILFSGRVGVGVPSVSRLSGDAWTTFQSTPNGLSTVGFTEATFNSTRRVFALSKLGTPKLWQLDGNRWLGIADGASRLTEIPRALCTVNTPSGDAIFITGDTSSLVPNIVSRIDGTMWSNASEGLPLFRNDSAFSGGVCFGHLTVNSETRVVIGGDFTPASGSNAARYLAAWDGSRWSQFEPAPPSCVLDVTMHDFGHGPIPVALVGLGNNNAPSTYDNMQVMKPYRLVAGAWQPFGEVTAIPHISSSTGFSSSSSLASQYFPQGVIRSVNGTLWMGGPFYAVDGKRSYYLAQYRCECTADFNKDAALDFFDYLDFVDRFSTVDNAADINADGIVDFFDYLDFVERFAAGC